MSIFPILPFLLRKKNFHTCLNQIYQIYILNPDHQIDQIHCFDIQMLHVLCFSLLLVVCVAAASVQPPGIIKCSLKCLKCLIPLGAQFLYLLLNTVPTNSLFMCASTRIHSHTHGDPTYYPGNSTSSRFLSRLPWVNPVNALWCVAFYTVYGWMCVSVVRCFSLCFALEFPLTAGPNPLCLHVNTPGTLVGAFVWGNHQCIFPPHYTSVR